MLNLKLLTLSTLIFGAGYMIGNSSNEELKKTIDNILTKFEIGGKELRTMLLNLINNSENLSTDEIQANIEKLISKALDKIEEIK